jgi:hypothetical protein
MRWNVDLSAIGSDQPPMRYCVEAEQWQKALQHVRALRGDEGPLGSFSIELLDDGYRAIDPMTRTRFVVTRAPDDAALSEQPKAIEKEAPAEKSNGAAPPRPSNRGARPSERGRNRRNAAMGALTIPTDPIPRPQDAVASPSPIQEEITERKSAPVLSPVAPLVPARPMQAETAFERMTGGSAVPLPPEVAARADVPTQILGEFRIASRRNEDPTPSSPLTYRELGIVVPQATTLADAEAIARAQLNIVQNAIGGAPKGRYVQLAIFDYEYSGKPSKGPPILTLTYKDWRGETPEVRFPKRDGVVAGPSSLPPRSLPPSTAVLSVTPSTTRSDESSLIAQQMMSIDSIPSDPARLTKPTKTHTGDAFSETTRVVPRAEAAPSEPPVKASEPPATEKTDLPAPSPGEEPIQPSPVLSVGAPVPEARLDHTSGSTTLASASEPTSTAPSSAEASAAASAPTPAAEPSKSAAPPPTPSELRRNAADMSGDDDLTMVKESQPPAETPEVVEIVIPPASALPREAAAPMATASAPPATASAPPAPIHDASAPPARTRSTPPPPPKRSAPPPAAAADGAIDTSANALPEPQFQAERKPSSRTLADGTATWADLAKQAELPPRSRVESTPPPSRLPPGGHVVRPANPSRKGGDELISDLFEACSDLAFVHDPLDAAEFVAGLLLDGIPSLAVLISFFDINTRDFVVVRQVVTKGAGEDLPNVVLSRASEFTPAIARAMRGGRSVVAMGSECVAVTTDPRWSALGIVPTAMISAPVAFGGRYLGLVELFNPLDGGPLRESDGHALTYVGEQFAEYLAQRDISIDPDYVRRPKLAQLARR